MEKEAMHSYAALLALYCVLTEKFRVYNYKWYKRIILESKAQANVRALVDDVRTLIHHPINESYTEQDQKHAEQILARCLETLDIDALPVEDGLQKGISLSEDWSLMLAESLYWDIFHDDFIGELGDN